MQSISWQDRDGARWIQLEGDVDQDVVRRIQGGFLDAVREAGGDVVVLLRGVPFMATPGIGLLIGARRILEERGARLRLSGLRPKLREILRTMELLPLFEEV